MGSSVAATAALSRECLYRPGWCDFLLRADAYRRPRVQEAASLCISRYGRGGHRCERCTTDGSPSTACCQLAHTTAYLPSWRRSSCLHLHRPQSLILLRLLRLLLILPGQQPNHEDAEIGAHVERARRPRENMEADPSSFPSFLPAQAPRWGADGVVAWKTQVQRIRTRVLVCWSPTVTALGARLDRLYTVDTADISRILMVCREASPVDRLCR